MLTISIEEATAVPTAATTALWFLREGVFRVDRESLSIELLVVWVLLWYKLPSHLVQKSQLYMVRTSVIGSKKVKVNIPRPRNHPILRR